MAKVRKLERQYREEITEEFVALFNLALEELSPARN